MRVDVIYSECDKNVIVWIDKGGRAGCCFRFVTREFSCQDYLIKVRVRVSKKELFSAIRELGE